MHYLRLLFFSFNIILLSAGCNHFYQPQQLSYSGYQVTKGDSADKNVLQLLQPYADSVMLLMSDTIGRLDVSLQKKLPDGTLGNFIADAYLEMAKIKWNSKAEIAFMNHGGIRVNSISAGPVKRSALYEVMPFDNEMVLMEVKGEVLREYLDAIAKDGGGGVAGIRFVIRDQKATDIMIGDRPLESSTKYWMVNSDYVVNGGGGFNGFRSLPKTRTAYLLRDALLDYAAIFKQKGEVIKVYEERRIILAK